MTRIKKKTLAVFIAAILVLQAVIVIPVSAASFRITANQDDIYKKLEEAAKLNVLTRALRKCLDSDQYMPYRMDYVDEAGNHYSQNYVEGGDLAAGEIFNDPGWFHTDLSTARWLENQMGAGDDGKYWCNEGQGEGTGLFDLYADALGMNKVDLLCNGNEARIMSRAIFLYDDDHVSAVPGYYPINERCSNLTDDMAIYILSPNYASALEGIYNDYKASSGNQFLPDFSTIGQYNNIDGYFNYYIDFKLACGAEMYSEPRSDVEIYPVTTFDKEDLKIVAKTNYVHITADDSWEGALSTDNPVTTCAGLLTRIEELHNTWNGIAATRNAGYEGIIAYILQETCNNMTDSEGNNVWTKLKTELQKIVNDPDAPEKAKADAQASLTKINNAGGNYMTITGDYTDPEGKIYECLDVDELEVHLSDYTYGMEDWEEEEMAEADCYTNAGSLGWIVCPLITTGADMIQGTYEGMVVPFLRLDPQLFKADNGTYMAWDVFRNISNIAFVAVFLVVILSQLTGYGIDNYGIKKILPKLIVAAILINMSYVICQLAIDIANIFGSAIGDLFTSIGNKIMINSPPVCSSGGADACVAVTAGKSGGAGGWIAIIAVVLAITVGAVLAIGPQILIPVLLAILSFVIAIFFLFIILGVRQALSVLLVAISPCAFLCYMLPNTKMIFNKWFTTIKGILLAYPICSAMIYGGDMVAKIIIAAYGGTPKDLASITPMLSAGIVAVAPIFLIPSTIKKSMGGLGSLAGNLQGRLNHRATGFARGALHNTGLNNPDRGLVTGAIRRHSRYAQQQRADNVMARQSEYNAKKGNRELYGKRMFGGKNLSQMAEAGTLNAEQKRRYNRALSAVNSESANNLATYASSYKAMGGDDNIIASVQQSLDNGSLTADQFAAAIQATHDEDKVAKLLSLNNTSTGNNVLSKFKGTGANNVNNRQKIADALTARSGNIYAQSAGKLINSGPEGMDLNKMMSSGELQNKIRGAGDSIMASQDKDVFNIAGMGNMLSASQLAAGVGAGYSGTTAGNFNSMLEASGRGDEVLNSMSMEQLARVTSQAYAGSGGNKSSLDALGGETAIKGNANTASLITALNSTGGTQARSAMDGATMSKLGIKEASQIISSDVYIGKGKHATPVQINIYSDGTAKDAATGNTVDLKNYSKKVK